MSSFVGISLAVYFSTTSAGTALPHAQPQQQQQPFQQHQPCQQPLVRTTQTFEIQLELIIIIIVIIIIIIIILILIIIIIIISMHRHHHYLNDLPYHSCDYYDFHDMMVIAKLFR